MALVQVLHTHHAFKVRRLFGRRARTLVLLLPHATNPQHGGYLQILKKESPCGHIFMRDLVNVTARGKILKLTTVDRRTRKFALPTPETTLAWAARLDTAMNTHRRWVQTQRRRHQQEQKQRQRRRQPEPMDSDTAASNAAQLLETVAPRKTVRPLPLMDAMIRLVTLTLAVTFALVALVHLTDNATVRHALFAIVPVTVYLSQRTGWCLWPARHKRPVASAIVALWMALLAGWTLTATLLLVGLSALWCTALLPLIHPRTRGSMKVLGITQSRTTYSIAESPRLVLAALIDASQTRAFWEQAMQTCSIIATGKASRARHNHQTRDIDGKALAYAQLGDQTVSMHYRAPHAAFYGDLELFLKQRWWSVHRAEGPESFVLASETVEPRDAEHDASPLGIQRGILIAPLRGDDSSSMVTVLETRDWSQLGLRGLMALHTETALPTPGGVAASLVHFLATASLSTIKNVLHRASVAEARFLGASSDDDDDDDDAVAAADEKQPDATSNATAALAASPQLTDVFRRELSRKYAPLVEQKVQCVLADGMGPTEGEGWTIVSRQGGVVVSKRAAEGTGLVVKGRGVIGFAPSVVLELLWDSRRKGAFDSLFDSANWLVHVDEQTRIEQQLYKAPLLVVPRDMVLLGHWRAIPGGFCLATCSIVYDGCPPMRSHVRAHVEYGGFVLRAIAGGTEATFVACADLKGRLPGWAKSAVQLRQPMQNVAGVATYLKSAKDQSRMSVAVFEEALRKCEVEQEEEKKKQE